MMANALKMCHVTAGKRVPIAALVILICLALLVPLASEGRNYPIAQDPNGSCVGTGGGGGPGDPTFGGWGKDCTSWISYSDPWAGGEMCYDPLGGAGGEGWRLCSAGGPVTWPGLDIELWIEMECAFTWGGTHVQIHRASDYDDLVVTFCGTSACNNSQYIITTPPTAVGSLATLPFVRDMFGRTTGTGIPLTWEYSRDGSPWAPMSDLADPPGSKYFLVSPCDHSFCIKVVGDVAYHQGDGYYQLSGEGGSICPAEPL
jgi:hypothetical protein